jgi:hypothetical protein
MKHLAEFWRSLFTSTETALLRAENKRLKETNFALEDENEQLRKELRGTVNTVLSQAGVAPLPPHEEVKAPVRKMTMRRLTFQQRQRLYAAVTAPKEKDDARRPE